MIKRGFAPIFDKNSKILILGSMPSIASIKFGFYYGHKNNRFWKTLAAIFDDKLLVSRNLEQIRILDLQSAEFSAQQNFKQTESKNSEIYAKFAINGKINVHIKYKIDFLLREKIALYDTVKSADIKGSADASIKNYRVNDLDEILEIADIKAIFANGKKSYEVAKKVLNNDKRLILLNSTSSANARVSLDDLINEWSQKIFKFL